MAVTEQLARRGAQVIALVPSLADPLVQELVPAIRTATSNELIYAEECDLGSITSIRHFCAGLVQPHPTPDGQGRPEPSRLDAVIMLHEYEPEIPESVMGDYADGELATRSQRRRERAALASSLLVSSILPSLLRAPTDRDIRFINAINPLYAAGIPSFTPIPTAISSLSDISLIKEGDRSLRSIIYSRHLQRVLDALASSRGGSSSDTSTGPAVVDPKDTTVPSLGRLYTGSNIVSVVVTPGYHSTFVRTLVRWLLSRPRRFRIPFLSSLLYPIVYVL